MDRWKPWVHAGLVEAWIIVPLGLLAGGLTTVAGVGGGMVLTLVLAAAWDPYHALAVAAPALLLGNMHRLWLLRREVDRGAGLAVAVPAFVGSVVGGVLTAALPEGVIRWLLVLVTMLALARELGPVRLPGGRAWLWGGGVLVGVVGATTGGGGLVLGPLLLMAGLRGLRFVATGAVVGFTMHVGQALAFGGTGLLGAGDLPLALGLGVAIVAGNVGGRRLRPRLGERTCHRLTWFTLLGGVALALLGVR